jgi:predicted metal-dependent phosphoesterase TrpH
MGKELLKVDLHTHSADDPEEYVAHTSCELIDKAHRLGFDALSITSHKALLCPSYLQEYAHERGIVLIPGAELEIEGKHVLVINAHEGIVSARTFDDLRRLRTPENLIVAPHPYHPGRSSLLWKLRRSIDVFDAIEFSWFYHRHINFNTFAVRVAARHGLPLLCTSDCHHLEKFGSAFSFVQAEKNVESIVRAVKAGRVEIAADPLSLFEFGKHSVEHVFDNTIGALFHAIFDGDL